MCCLNRAVRTWWENWLVPICDRSTLSPFNWDSIVISTLIAKTAEGGWDCPAGHCEVACCFRCTVAHVESSPAPIVVLTRYALQVHPFLSELARILQASSAFWESSPRVSWASQSMTLFCLYYRVSAFVYSNGRCLKGSQSKDTARYWNERSKADYVTLLSIFAGYSADCGNWSWNLIGFSFYPWSFHRLLMSS